MWVHDCIFCLLDCSFQIAKHTKWLKLLACRKSQTHLDCNEKATYLSEVSLAPTATAFTSRPAYANKDWQASFKKNEQITKKFIQ